MKQVKQNSISSLPSEESSFRELFDKRIEESENELAFFSSKTVTGDKSYWEGNSWSEVRRDMTACMRSLVSMGVKENDRVGYYGHCSYEQIILFYSLMYMNVRIVTWFSNLRGQALTRHVPALIFVEKYTQFQKVKREFSGCKVPLPDAFRAVVISPVSPSGSSMVRGFSPFSDERLLPWSAFLRLGRGVSLPSGGTGVPLGDDTAVLESFSPISGGGAVSLSRRLLLSSARAGWSLLRPRASDALLHFSHPASVPAFHVSLLFPLFSPFCLYLLPRPSLLFAALRQVQPTLLCAHADFWGALYAALAQLCPEAKLSHLSPLSLARLRTRVGLRRLRLGLSSGAAAPYALAAYYSKLGVPLTEVYGVARCGGALGAVHLANERRYAVPRLRPLLPVRVAKDSLELEAEVCGKWVPTGDAAEVGETVEGTYFRVLGNMGDAMLAVRSDGAKERLWPAYAETQFRGSPLIRQAFVDMVGGLCVAVLVVDPWVCKRMAGIRGLYPKEFVQSSEVGALLRKVCLEINLARSKGGGASGDAAEAIEGGWTWPRAFPIRRFTVVPRFLSVRRGELTPVMTINRRVLRESLREELEVLASQAPLGGLVHRSLSPMPSVTEATWAGLKAPSSASASSSSSSSKSNANTKTSKSAEELQPPAKRDEPQGSVVDYVQTRSQESALREGRLTDGVFYLRSITLDHSGDAHATAAADAEGEADGGRRAGDHPASTAASTAAAAAASTAAAAATAAIQAPTYTPSKFEIAQVERMEEELQERMSELRGNVNQLKRLQEESDALQRKLQDELELTKHLQSQLKKAKKRSKSK